MLMDLEQRRVIDLLPVRSAASFADWLRQHRGVEIIARDRCGLYAEGGHKIVPAAVQVADRYHLMRNLSEAVEHTLQQLQIEAARNWPKKRAEALEKINSGRSPISALPPGAL